MLRAYLRQTHHSNHYHNNQRVSHITQESEQIAKVSVKCDEGTKAKVNFVKVYQAHTQDKIVETATLFSLYAKMEIIHFTISSEDGRDILRKHLYW